MPISEAKRKANRKWDAQNIHQVKLSLPNDEYETLQAYVNSIGIPRTTFIRAAIKEKMEHDTSEQD